ncbi:MAG: transposase [Fusobacteriales bacterium]|jgi:transposase|nr:transposase [Fusobacteriales bacterium]
MKEAKRYDKVFKATIVELHKKGRSIAQLSREYGISKQSIGSWIKLSKKIGKVEGEEISYKELLELRKKVKELEEDNDI